MSATGNTAGDPRDNARPDAAAPLDVLNQMLGSAPRAGVDAPGARPDSVYEFSDAQPPPANQPPRTAATDDVATVGYARETIHPPAIGGGPSRYNAIVGPRRTFWQDIRFAYVFPFANTHNTTHTLIVLGIGALGASTFCLGRVVDAWIASVLMNVVIDAASGSDDFHGARTDAGWWDGYGAPAMWMLLSLALAQSPTIVYYILVRMGWIHESPLLLWMWTVGGVFFWPMFMLLMSLESASLVFRIDLILLTVVRTLPAYLVIWLTLLVPSLAVAAAIFGVGLIEEQLTSRSASHIVALWYVLRILEQVVTIYLAIVAMRCIGLYYLHFKRRFAFRLE